MHHNISPEPLSLSPPPPAPPLSSPPLHLLSLFLTDWAGSDRLMSDSPEDIAAWSILMVLVNFQWSQVIKRPGSIPLVTQLGQPSLSPQCGLWGGDSDGDPIHWPLNQLPIISGIHSHGCLACTLWYNTIHYKESVISPPS